MKLPLLRHLVVRLALFLSVFLIGAASTPPMWVADTQSQSEEEEGPATASAPLLEIAARESPAARRRGAVRAELAPLSTAELFAVYRQAGFLPPPARGPDSLLAPIPHLLN